MINTLPSTVSTSDKLAALTQMIGADHVKRILDCMNMEEAQNILETSSKGSRTFSDKEMHDILLEFVTIFQKSNKEPASANATDEGVDTTGTETWDQLSTVHDEALSTYLKNESPQAVAIIMSKLQPKQAARMMTMLPPMMNIDVLTRMVKMDCVKQEILSDIEQTLRSEFLHEETDTLQNNMHASIAEIFNYLDPEVDASYLNALENVSPESVKRIRELMFNFEDLTRLAPQDVRVLLRHINRNKLSLALKKASTEIKTLFFQNMPTRAGKLLQEAIEELGSVRLRDIEEAQVAVTCKAQMLAAQGDITLSPSEKDTMVD